MTQHNNTTQDAYIRITAMNIGNIEMNKQEMQILHTIEHTSELSKHLPIYQNQHNTMMMLIYEQIDNEIAIESLLFLV